MTLAACMPDPVPTPYTVSDEFIWTAIAQTEAALPSPTATRSPTGTATLTPTPTVTRTPTATETPIPSFTPIQSPTSDFLVLANDPQEFLLSVSDLPLGAGYYIPKYPPLSDGVDHYTNDILKTLLGAQSGQAFIDATGRIDGWRIIFHHNNTVPGMPEEITCEISRYKTNKGARIAVAGTGLIGWTELEKDIELGDLHRIFSNSAMFTDGAGSKKPMLWYGVSFAYRNFSVFLRIWGWADTFEFDIVENLARTILEKMEAALPTDPDTAPWVTPEVTPSPSVTNTPSPNP